LISKSFGPDFRTTDGTPRSPQDQASTPSDNLEVDDDDVEEAHLDEAELESGVISEEATADSALKKRALDRLAEVLSRFKTAKCPPARTKSGNLDAKHVASIVLIEDLERGRATFVCSKNEGLDAIDGKFLWQLKGLLERATRGMWNFIFYFSLPLLLFS
jgi:hypothetical protein